MLQWVGVHQFSAQLCSDCSANVTSRTFHTSVLTAYLLHAHGFIHLADVGAHGSHRGRLFCTR